MYKLNFLGDKLSTISECKEFIDNMGGRGWIFHWEDKTSDIVREDDHGDTVKVFSDEQVSLIDERLEEMFTVWNSEDIFNYTLRYFT
tara:strand:- start:78 stop:338 length:261 start_codon:yes stop_codon:yes gene_type:complete